MGKYLDIANALEARRRAEQIATPSSSPSRGFLEKHLPSAVEATFPDWQGLLIKSVVLGLCVWVVRSRQDGEDLAKKTGHPALLLDDVLSQKGRTPAEARVALLPVLIAPVQ